MECMASALKPSLRREMAAATTTHHAAGDEDWLAGLGGGAAAATEDFSVDDLLDFSNGELDGGKEEGDEVEKDSVSISSTDGVDDDSNSNSGSFSCSGSSDDSESILAGGLAVPVDDIAELEWVSRFVDDSLSELPLLYPTGKWKAEKDADPETRFEPVSLKPPQFPPVPVKTRSKRPRTGRQSTSSPLSESSSTSSCSAWSSSSVKCLLAVPQGPEGKRKKKARHAVQQAGSVLFQRRCSHCGVQKTPQWRAGPYGAKTLCNACGVRYKSGRLFPEYRPACSPTFSVEMHSNSHRKVLEMRKKKEVTFGGVELDHMMVSSF